MFPTILPISQLTNQQPNPKLNHLPGIRDLSMPQNFCPMSKSDIETPRLRLILDSLEDARVRIDALPPANRAELSADWVGAS